MTSETQGERIASLEAVVKGQSEEIIELKFEVASMSNKLDELLALKNKGAGAFWFASIIVGSGFIATLGSIFHWWK